MSRLRLCVALFLVGLVLAVVMVLFLAKQTVMGIWEVLREKHERRA